MSTSSVHPRMNAATLTIIASTLALIVSLFGVAQAQTPPCIDFDGADDPPPTDGGEGTELAEPNNWVGDVLPTAADDACVDSSFGAVELGMGDPLRVGTLFSGAFIDVSDGRLTLDGNSTLDGIPETGTANVVVRDAGEFVVDGPTTVGDGVGEVALSNGGFLGGDGAIDGDLINGGFFGPGPGVNEGVGAFTIFGGFTQGPQGETRIQIEQGDGPEADVIQVTGAVDMLGTVFVEVGSGVDLPLGQELTIVEQPIPSRDAQQYNGLTPFDVDVNVVDNRSDVDFEPITDQTNRTLALRTIQEPPPAPSPDPLQVSLSDVEVEEGDDGTTEVDLTATLNRTAGFDVDLEVEVTGVTGLEEIDFTDAAAFAQALGTIKIPAGATAASLTLEVIGDGTPEPDETIEATILSVAPTSVQVDQGSATVTILDDDPAPSLDDASLVPTTFDDTCLVDTDGLGLAKDEPLDTAQIASMLLSCIPLSQVDTVLIGRDDDFADSLSSGFLQSQSPLLLVPGDGPIPPEVVAQLQQLAPRQVLILGGVDAVGPAIETELAALGIEVIRRAGPTRIETAIDVAATDAADATTAIIARAFPSGADPSQAFADAIAAGGMAADLGYPVLLTDPASLSSNTATYLQGSQITDVLIMGGTAAVSELTEAQIAEIVPGTVTRVAGDSRAGTAIEVAKARGSDSAADVTDLIVVEGQTEFAWAGGLTAAFLAAATDAPIVLLANGEIPPETAAYLQQQPSAAPAFAVEPGEGTVVCAAASAGCFEARRLLGLDDATVTFDPPSLTPADLGTAVEVDIPDLPDGAEVTYGGSCLLTTTDDPAEVVIRDDAGGPPLPCLVVVTITYPSGVIQTVTAAYTE